MNPFTVEWDPDAEDELARIWLAAADPSAITQAQAEIDRRLSRNPAGHGRYLSEDLWQIHGPPLLANFTLDTSRNHVQVTWVRLVP